MLDTTQLPVKIRLIFCHDITKKEFSHFSLEARTRREIFINPPKQSASKNKFPLQSHPFKTPMVGTSF